MNSFRKEGKRFSLFIDIRPVRVIVCEVLAFLLRGLTHRHLAAVISIRSRFNVLELKIRIEGHVLGRIDVAIQASQFAFAHFIPDFSHDAAVGFSPRLAVNSNLLTPGVHAK
jgi:hypothetical protein